MFQKHLQRNYNCSSAEVMLRHKFKSAFFQLFPLQHVPLLLGFIQIGTLRGELIHRKDGFARADLPGGSRTGSVRTMSLPGSLLHVAHLEHYLAMIAVISLHLSGPKSGWPMCVYAYVHYCSIQHILNKFYFLKDISGWKQPIWNFQAGLSLQRCLHDKLPPNKKYSGTASVRCATHRSCWPV